MLIEQIQTEVQTISVLEAAVANIQKDVAAQKDINADVAK